jgi:hypothetical protein
MKKLACMVVLFPMIALAQEGKDKGAPAAPPAAKDKAPAAPAAADKAAAAPAAPAAKAAPAPEVKKTVDAFVSIRPQEIEMTAPGMDKPITTKFNMSCKKASGGRAAACTAKMKGPQGPWEGSFLASYDEGTKTVHFMGVTSDGEVHDHVCRWTDDKTVTCDPLKYTTVDGAQAYEDLKMTFDGKNSGFHVVQTLPDGGKLTMRTKTK